MEPPTYATIDQPGVYSTPAVPSQPGVGVGGGQQIQMMMYPRTPSVVYGNYRSKESLGLGVTQIIVGVLSIIWNAVGLAYAASINTGAYGIWGGILFIITGAFGIAASKSRSRCQVIAFMVLCIISATVAAVLLICGIIGAVITAGSYSENCNYNYRYNTYYSYSYGYYEACQIGIAMDSLLAIMGLIEGIVAIWGSAICCKAACCCNSTTNQVMVPLQYVPMQGNQQMILIAQPQQQQHGGPMMAYAPQGYPAQQYINMPAPAYPASYGMSAGAPMTSPGMGFNTQEEVKQPL